MGAIGNNVNKLRAKHRKMKRRYRNHFDNIVNNSSVLIGQFLLKYRAHETASSEDPQVLVTAVCGPKNYTVF